MKKFTLTISVDEDKLQQTYLDRQNLIEEDLPSTSELVSQEFGWLKASGIALISEVHESKPQLNQFHIFQTLSGNFLTTEVRDDWEKLTEEQQHQFIENHKWQQNR